MASVRMKRKIIMKKVKMKRGRKKREIMKIIAVRTKKLFVHLYAFVLVLVLACLLYLL